ncbi:CMF receptor CMFR1 [Micractinium conductrix]|uniref:CMF receptor CMFR1 n=1 Tax=Micractinium conductrix TaxID=554055 RepID=A0A2P6V4X2_9CHLO|nr:CMF receptor CMFR1 [Micractinium conductrix]|eukprot:PSC69140.1 CMF receptor CMFR1 [Micractinium conductrix]
MQLPDMSSVKDNKAVLGAAAVTAAVGGGLLLRRALRQTKPLDGPYKPSTLPEGCYDVIIVGAGPSGSVCGYYLAKGGAKVALLDKEHFPRDKICGDAVCTPAIHILNDMGVIDELKKHDEVHFADNGGFISPSGLAYIGNSQHKLGTAAACAVKRIDLDKRTAAAAKAAGAELMEGFEVGKDVSLNKEQGLWSVKSTDGKVVRGRMLVCADGSTSRLATQLGYCTAPPQGVSSRAYIAGGSHNADFDGLVFYPKWSLPGYAAIFKHAKDELGFCYYLIPCGKKAEQGQCGSCTADDLKRLHENAIKHDPFISRAMGPNPKCERMRAGSLRVGGQGLKTTYDDNIIIIGDAAGFIDPLTGEGIHTAMMGGKAAAEVLLQCREAGDFSKRSTRLYERRWMELFGHDFKLSQKGAELIWKYPILLDACANEVQRQGDAMMSKWAEVMTNMRPKTYFLRPDVAIPLGFALVRELWNQKIMCRPSAYVMPAEAAAK